MAAPVRMIQSVMCAEAANSQTMLVTDRHVEFTYKKMTVSTNYLLLFPTKSDMILYLQISQTEVLSNPEHA